ncbi:MAG: hypothetical protein M1826_004658 [Phylliscum demangeonii]|nr:MAG: hypothetical protein M1826_004658 [Phylliscum demangeonii]
MPTQTAATVPAMEPSMPNRGRIGPDGVDQHALDAHLLDNLDVYEDESILRLVCRLIRGFATRLYFSEVLRAKEASAGVTSAPTMERSLVDIVCGHLQSCNRQVREPSAADRRVPLHMSTIIVEWVRTIMMKAWDGQEEIARFGVMGSAVTLLECFYERREVLGVRCEEFQSPFFDRMDPIEVAPAWHASLPSHKTLHLLSYPFLFSHTTLVKHFRSLCYTSLSRAYEDSINTLRQLSSLSALDPVHAHDGAPRLFERLRAAITGHLVLEVRRHDVIVDAFDQLWRRERRELLRPLKVRMGLDEGEEGVDHGGVQQEFFTLVFAHVLHPDHGLFDTDSQTRRSWFKPCSAEPLYKFELIGLLMALAAYNGITLTVGFPQALYRKLLGRPVNAISHIRDGWPELSRAFDTLLAWEEGDVSNVFMRTYEFSFASCGQRIDVDMQKVGRDQTWPRTTKDVARDRAPNPATPSSACLSTNVSQVTANISQESQEKEDGQSVEAELVTNANRAAYVKDYIFWLTDKSVRPQYEAFAKGFFTCLDKKTVKLLTPQGFQSLVEGSQIIDTHGLQRAARYDEEYHPRHPLIRQFWDIVHQYSPHRKRRLLEFVTASERVPVGGIMTVNFTIQRNGPDSDAFHNLSYSKHNLPDPVLTSRGTQQCFDRQQNFAHHATVDLVVASPLRRTLQTALLAFEPATERGLKVIALPELQETGALACDTGSDVNVLQQEFDPEKVDLRLVQPGWNVKTGRFAAQATEIEARAKVARQWLKARPEKEIVVVSHGGFLHYLTEDWTDGDRFRGTGWQNMELRTYRFAQEEGEDDYILETEESKNGRQTNNKAPSKPEEYQSREVAKDEGKLEEPKD